MTGKAWIGYLIAAALLMCGIPRMRSSGGQAAGPEPALPNGETAKPTSVAELTRRVQALVHAGEAYRLATGVGPVEVAELQMLLPPLEGKDPAMRDKALELLMNLSEHIVNPVKDSTPYWDAKYPLNVRMVALVLSVRGAVPANVKKLSREAYLKAMEEQWSAILREAGSLGVSAPYLPQAVASLGAKAIPVERIIRTEHRRIILRRALAGMVEAYMDYRCMKGLSLVAVQMDCGPEEIAAWYPVAPSARARGAMLEVMYTKVDWSDETIRTAYAPVLRVAEKDWNWRSRELTKRIRKKIDGMR